MIYQKRPARFHAPCGVLPVGGGMDSMRRPALSVQTPDLWSRLALRGGCHHAGWVPQRFSQDVVVVGRERDMPVKWITKNFGSAESCLRRWAAHDNGDVGLCLGPES